MASNPSSLVDSLSGLMMHGSMSADMKTSILTALQAVPAGTKQQTTVAQTAIYLIATSSQYQVRH
jgi:membrane protease subunit (stomatin/prohibitin family)